MRFNILNYIKKKKVTIVFI